MASPIHSFVSQINNKTDVTSQERLNLLHQNLLREPYRFDLCNQLIQGYMELKCEDKVTTYREHAAAYCPTSEEFWLSWISDTKKKLSNAFNTAQEADLESHIIQLYRTALFLCPTADLWVLYLKFVKQRSFTTPALASHPNPAKVSQIRHIGECALRDLGLHGTEGPKIWSVYRHFEQFLLQGLLEQTSCLKPSCVDEDGDRENSDLSPTQDIDHSPIKMAKEQAERVRYLFCRQMQLPLAGLQDVWDEYRIFEAELPTQLVIAEDITNQAVKLHETGLVEWEKRKTMELQVMMSDDDKIETIQRLSSGWTNYVNFEKSMKSYNQKLHVCTLYLRACEDLGHLRADLWFAWFHWILTELQDSNLASRILERAVRCHPTQCRLWTAYLSCERLRKPADVNRSYKIFLKALKSVDVKRCPNDVVTLSKSAADCIIHSFHLAPSTISSHTPKSSVSQNVGHGDAEGVMNHFNVVLDKDFEKDILESEGVLTLLGFSSPQSPETKTLSLNQRIGDIFSSAEFTLIHFISCSHNLIPLEQGMSHGKRLYNSIESAFRSLRNLWKEWLMLCTTTITDFHHCESVASRVLFCTTPAFLSKLNKLNSLDHVKWRHLLNITSENHVNRNGEDWTLVAEALTFSWVSAKHHPPLDEIWALGKRVVNNHLEVFLNRWFQLSLIAEVPSIAMDVSALLQVQSDSPLRISSMPPPSALTNTSSLWLEFRAPPPEASSPLLTEADTSVMEVTLNQLKSRREKRRRRRYSECDSEPCLSDTSSDSSSVSSVLSSTPSSFLLRKRLRSVSQNSTSQQRRLGVHPVSEPFQLSLPIFHGLDHTSHSANDTDKEVELIERATQSTWNGHECDGDPSLTPPVPPIVSDMSPLRRRCSSSSISSNSPVSLSSDATCVSLPYCPPSFVTSTQHQCELPENLQNVSVQQKVAWESMEKNDDELIDQKNKRNRSQSWNSEVNTSMSDEKKLRDTFSATMTTLDPQVGHHYKHFVKGLTNGSKEDIQNFRNHILELMGCKEEKKTLYVWNLDESVTQSDVERLFSPCKGLIEIRMVRDRKGKFKGFCYIDFETEYDAEQAESKSQSLIHNDRAVKVKRSEPKVPTYEEKTLFFTTQIPSLDDISANQLAEEISVAVASETEKVLSRVIRPKATRPRSIEETKKLKGYGYIDFATAEEAQLVLQALLGKAMRLVGFDGSFSLFPSIPMKRHKPILAPHVKKSVKEKKEKNQFIPQSCVLFVKNLNFSTTNEGLKNHFSQFGKVTDVQLCVNEKNQSSKGYGFVTLASEEDAFSCRMLNDSFLDGRQILVSTSHRVPTLPSLPKSFPPKKIIQKKSDMKQRLFPTRFYEKLHASTKDADVPSSGHQLKNADFKKYLPVD